MSWVKEFRQFAVRGNVVDLAVGVIIGAAFGKIVSSVVEDIVMPLVGILIGGFDFKGLFIQVGQSKVMYGKFLQTCVDFVIIAAAIFVAVKFINRLREQFEEKEAAAPATPPAPPRQEVLLEEIRDLLKSKA